MNIAIVDDENIWQTKIKDELISYYNEKAQIEVVFMDLEFAQEKEDGLYAIEVYKRNYPETVVIILTTHTELARLGYKVDAFRYIDKLHLEDLQEALESLDKKFIQNEDVSFYLTESRMQKIRCCDIIYVEARGRKVELVTLKGIFLCNEGIEQIETRLKKYGFFRSHRSYLINLAHVTDYRKNEIYMAENHKVSLSRRRHEQFLTELFQWGMERANG